MNPNVTSGRINMSHGRSVLRALARVISGNRHWVLPDLNLLSDTEQADKEADYDPPINPDDLIKVLDVYGVEADFEDYRIGSAVTTYEVRVKQGTRLSNIQRRRDDIARDLGLASIRICTSLTDPSLLGFEVENSDRFSVGFKEMVQRMPSDMTLPIALGEDTYGNPRYVDLATMPHLLVAGQTGSGKSVFLNTLIAGLISRMTPSQLQFMVIDPKGNEFKILNDLPHLYRHDGQELEVATNPESARYLLRVTIEEMNRRFELLDRKKNIEEYNKVAKDKIPYVVFVVDEFADLMMRGSNAERKVLEDQIAMIAQKSRAVGIHMVLATQKPLAKVMTSLIKANMPARVAFSVSCGTDSRVILDESGAETLTGRGDMLFRDPYARSEAARLLRIQGAWISDEELEILIKSGKEQI